MQDFGSKTDNSPPPGGQLSAAEFNNLATESENAVSRSGQTLSGASDTQLAQSLFIHGVKSASFQDSGAANAYVATPISGASGVLLPSGYSPLDGSIISFKASNSNSGASTLNIGQTTGILIGAKAIRLPGDVALTANSINAGEYVQVVYSSTLNAGAGAWELVDIYSMKGGFQAVTSSGSFTVPAGIYKLKYKVIGAGGGSGGVAAAASGGAGGGGGGGSAEGVAVVTPGQVITTTIGAGGTAGAVGGAGGTGGTTSLVGIASASGGQGGGGNVINQGGTGGFGGSGLTGTLLLGGGAGTFGAYINGSGGMGANAPGGTVSGGGFGIGGPGLIPGGGAGGSGSSSINTGAVGARGQINLEW